MESSIACLINDERASYGLQPVTAERAISARPRSATPTR